jgi:exodeoxyribonuclease VII large subunit
VICWRVHWRGVQQFGQQLDESLSDLRTVTQQRLADAQRATNELEIRLLRQGSQVRFGDFRNRIEQRINRVTQAAQGWIRDQDRLLQQRLWRLDRKSPERLLSARQQSVDSAISRIAQALRSKLAHDQQRVHAREELLHAVDPKQILKRGFAIVRLGKDKSVLRSVDQVRDGQRLSVTLSDGQFHATAEDPRQPTLFDE